ncbi:translocation and assembly module TamB [Methylomarinovum caldicuralii]|uniref:Translocation and assembly module TamB n=1 Tax=Methylomarinovum caldicuralii TaxID=438856 RepID=A0AAU9C359_9GAMM|nr:translocation/assembly module TamB domain-containing protein [Methylomarinovum caldicuralii]BCX81630.1 translocation and assembly module TamB [Methylomarinovum caldicuralii]
MRRLLFSLLLLVLGLPAAFLGLAATEGGTRALLRLADRLLPAVEIGRIEGILLKTLTLEEVTYHTPEIQARSRRLALSWRPLDLRRRCLTIERLTLTDPEIVLPESGEAAAITLPAVTLPLRIELRALDVTGFVVQQGESRTVLERLSLAATLEGSRLDLTRLEGQMGALTLAGGGRLRLEDDYPLNMVADWTYAGEPSFQGRAILRGNLRRLELDHRFQAPFAVTTAGSIQNPLETPQLDLAGGWEQLAWPPDGGEWRAGAGRYRLTGTLEDYRLSLQTQVRGKQLPPTRIDLSGRGNLESLTFDPLTAEGKSGHLTIRGKVAWQPALAWQLTLEGRDLDPGVWRQDWPGRLSLTAAVQGALAPVLAVEADIETLRGTLRRQPLEAKGRIRYRKGDLEAKAFQLEWGGNRLHLEGRAGDRLDLGLQLDAPRLDRLDPRLRGRVSGRGRLEGERRRPRLTAQLKGQNLSWDRSLRIAVLNLEAAGHPDDPAGHLRLEMQQLRLDNLTWQAISLTGSGSPAAHRLRLEARNPQGFAVITARGGWRPGAAAWDGTIEHVPLSLLQPLLPETKIRGALTGRFSFRQSGEKRRATLAWQLEEAVLETATSTGAPLRLDLSSGKGEAALEDPFLQADMVLPLPQGGLEAHIETRLDTHDLEGRVGVRVGSLAPLQALVPRLESLEGRLQGETWIAGTWEHPRLRGRLDLTDAATTVADAGIRLEQVEIHATGTGERIAIRGGATSGGGSLRLTGIWNPQDSLANLNLQGERFLAADLPQAKVRISPDLRLHAKGGKMEITGLVRVPEARLVMQKTLLPGQEPEMVTVSGDEVILGRPPPAKRPPLNLTARVRLVLGEAVFFEGYGIDSRLSGELLLTYRPPLPRAEGTIRLVDGKFAAYGQKLAIDSGRIIFSGPIDNPAIDLRVRRRIRREGITVTLEVTGFAREPRIRIASDPPIKEEEALAWLLTGRSLKRLRQQNGGSGRQALVQAAASLGLGYLQDLGLGQIAQVEFEEGFLTLGRYLTPTLYLGYAFDVFSGAGEMLVRYRLWRNLLLEGRAGQTRSVDLFYTLETD